MSSGFARNLKQPGLRIPLTADRGLFDEAVAIGREVIWLHTFGDRFAEGRPAGPPAWRRPVPSLPSRGRRVARLARRHAARPGL